MDKKIVGEVGLDAVIVTPLLKQRPRRKAAAKLESEVTLQLVGDLAKSPKDIFKRLAEAVLGLCHAESAGISLLDQAQNQFYWPGVSGKWRHYVGDGTPRDFGPCGTVLDRDATLLFSRPERHFAYLAATTPAIEECLLVPFHVDGEIAGTVWAISHGPTKRFDAEDARVLENLSHFTSLAFKTLVDIGALSNTPWSTANAV